MGNAYGARYGHSGKKRATRLSAAFYADAAGALAGLRGDSTGYPRLRRGRLRPMGELTANREGVLGGDVCVAEECIEGASAVVLLANHPEFEQNKLILNHGLPKNAVIYDG